MTKDEFILWLHGFFEISNAKTLNEEQTALIKGEVEKFFTKVTPDRTPPIDGTKIFDEYWKETIKNTPPVIPPAQTPNWPKYDPWAPTWETPRVTCGGLIYGEDFKTEPKPSYITC